MKVLVVGSGGREHALVWKIAKSPLVSQVIAAPGSDAIGHIAQCAPIASDDSDGQVALAKKEAVDLVVIGPEMPITAGLADRLTEAGLLVFSPSAKAAQLEGSKIFAKEFMVRHGIPTAGFSVHDTIETALEEVDRRSGPCVVKADGLAAGKGVIVCRDAGEARQAVREMLGERRFGSAGDRIIIEDLLQGEEASVLAICDGKQALPLIAAQDHKAAYDGDTGPNTGGMGAYAPAPLVDSAMAQRIADQVLIKTVTGMAAEGSPFKGVLYAGLMIVNGEPSVLEFNVRFGDPECQPLMALLEEDLVPVLVAAAKGEITQDRLQWHDGAAMCVVMASDGYPGAYSKGHAISGLDRAAEDPDVTVFHAGTARAGDQFVTTGGRVLGVTARASDIGTAAQKAYSAADRINWKGARMRRDIGHRAV
ncbi:MAG: phosphoribosylamine--glycine ligase [Myxococcota bacterium]|nr:phosphoribosylamine--glycine ligase [Myxococcota bacterium]